VSMSSEHTAEQIEKVLGAFARVARHTKVEEAAL
jgi:hypothetical protein